MAGLMTINVHAYCPSLNTESHVTQNNMGKSSYTDFFMGTMFSYLYNKGLLNPHNSVFIIGAGYGAGVSELLALGVDKIYLNDLSNQNLICAKKFINQTIPQKKNLISYLPGNIATSGLLEKMADDSIGLIYAKNVIPFLDAIQLTQLVKNSNKKLKRNGFLIFVFENPYLAQQIDMVKQIDIEFNTRKNNTAMLNKDDVVIDIYNDSTCSPEAYKNTPKSIRTSGFPCIVYGKDFSFNYLMPSVIERILAQNGFQLVSSVSDMVAHKTFIITAMKIK